MGRRRWLTFGTTLQAAATFRTYSFGPFRTGIRIKSMYLDCFSTNAQNAVVGLFAAPSPDRPGGAIVNPAAIPPGWTALHEHSHFDGGSIIDPEMFNFPIGGPVNTTPINLTNLEIDVVGQLFYLKVWINNRTAAAIDQQGNLTIEEDPPNLDGVTVDVRPIPGTEPPAPPPPAPPPPPPPAPPPPPPEPTPQLPGPLPLPAYETIPPITLDPFDPLASAREIYKP